MTFEVYAWINERAKFDLCHNLINNMREEKENILIISFLLHICVTNFVDKNECLWD